MEVLKTKGRLEKTFLKSIKDGLNYQRDSYVDKLIYRNREYIPNSIHNVLLNGTEDYSFLYTIDQIEYIFTIEIKKINHYGKDDYYITWRKKVL